MEKEGEEKEEKKKKEKGRKGGRDGGRELSGVGCSPSPGTPQHAHDPGEAAEPESIT